MKYAVLPFIYFATYYSVKTLITLTGRSEIMIYYGKRGQAFENLLDYTNEVYKRKGIALINKRPTPMKIIGQTRGKQHICVFDNRL